LNIFLLKANYYSFFIFTVYRLSTLIRIREKAMEPFLFLGFNYSNDVVEQNRFNLIYSETIVSYTVCKLNIKFWIGIFFIKLKINICNYVFRFIITMFFFILFMTTDHNSIELLYIKNIIHSTRLIKFALHLITFLTNLL